MWFKHDRNKEYINSDEYTKVLRSISELHSKIATLEGYIKIQQTGLDNLRGQFSRRLKGLQEETKKEEETKEINNEGTVYFG